jgi:hypothetical protein
VRTVRLHLLPHEEISVDQDELEAEEKEAEEEPAEAEEARMFGIGAQLAQVRCREPRLFASATPIGCCILGP